MSKKSFECEEHKGRLKEFYCMNDKCNKLICAICLTKYHQSHKFSDIQTFCESLIEGSNLDSKKIALDLRNMRTSILCIAQLKEIIAKELKEQKAFYANVTKVINHRLDEINRHINDMESKIGSEIEVNTKRLEGKIKNYEELNEEKDKLKKSVEGWLDKGRYYEIFDKRVELKGAERIRDKTTEKVVELEREVKEIGKEEPMKRERIQKILKSLLEIMQIEDARNRRPKMLEGDHSPVLLPKPPIKALGVMPPVPPIPPKAPKAQAPVTPTRGMGEKSQTQHTVNRQGNSTTIISPPKVKPPTISVIGMTFGVTNPLHGTIVHAFMENSFHLVLYDMERDKGEKIMIQNMKVPYMYDSVQIGNTMYMCGGCESVALSKNSKYLTRTYEFSVERKAMIRKGSMNYGKAGHTLVALNTQFFYSLGGQNNEPSYLDIVEKYDIFNNSWSVGPRLKQKKCLHSAVTFNNQIIYTFGGNSDTERLDTLHEEEGWSVIPLPPEQSLSKRAYTSSFQASTDSILIFGGLDLWYKSDSYLFNIPTGTMAKMEAMMAAEERFNQRKPVIYKDKVYIIGRNGDDLHIFNLTTKKWEFISQKAWYPHLA